MKRSSRLGRIVVSVRRARLWLGRPVPMPPDWVAGAVVLGSLLGLMLGWGF